MTPAEAGEALAEWFADMEETVERLNERDRWKELAEEARRQRNLSHYKQQAAVTPRCSPTHHPQEVLMGSVQTEYKGRLTNRPYLERLARRIHLIGRPSTQP